MKKIGNVILGINLIATSLVTLLFLALTIIYIGFYNVFGTIFYGVLFLMFAMVLSQNAKILINNKNQ